jgi:hypothetical protein
MNTATDEFAPGGATRSGTRREWRRPPWLRDGAPTWTWLGVGAVALGFVLIALAWGDVAHESQIYKQLPYIVSAGFSGLGLIIAGVTIVNVATRQRDTLQRNRQMERLITIMAELKSLTGADNE